jgi:hypothetical protein
MKMIRVASVGQSQSQAYAAFNARCGKGLLAAAACRRLPPPQVTRLRHQQKKGDPLDFLW